MEDIHNLWKSAKEIFKASTSATTFKSWIAPLEVLSTKETNEGGVIVELGAVNPFHQRMVEMRLKNQIVEVLSEIISKPVDLKLSLIEARLDLKEGKSKKEGLRTKYEGGDSDKVGPLFSETVTREEDFIWAVQRLGIREDYSFNNFAVSSSNEMAHAAAQAVALEMGKVYNPLFLYGGVGVGKTHLMHAIALETLKKNPAFKVAICAGEEFTNEIIEAIQKHTTPAFRNKYRKVKGLFIDDIQFIAGKNSVQEEFFHTFNTILKDGGQVVMTSDRPPAEIKLLEDRLRSRFEAGLLVDIGNPDFELRSAIVLIKAQRRRLPITMDMAQLIAGNIESARAIEGFLTKLMSKIQIENKTLSMDLIMAALEKGNDKGNKINTPPPMRPAEIIKSVADHFGINQKLLRAEGRSAKLVHPRHLAMYIMRFDYKIPLEEIGEMFNGRDHTTVMHAVDKVANKLTESEQMRLDLNELRRKMYN